MKSIFQIFRNFGHNSVLKYGFLILLLLLNSLSYLPYEVPDAEAQITKSIDFQPSIMDDVSFQYDRDNHWFELSYQSYYMRFRPFAIYNNEVFTQRQIVQILRSRGATYSDIIYTFKRALHWGFNITGIPQDIQENLNYLGFKLTDYNFPLSAISITYELKDHPDDITQQDINVTIFSIPKINLEYSFEDLQYQGYTVEIVNKTYLLIGNVANKADLLIDPITYSPNIMYATGGTSVTPLSWFDLWNASVTNNWNVSSQLNENATTLPSIPLQNRSFLFDCFIRIGNSSHIETWFNDSMVQVYFTDTIASANFQSIIYIYGNAYFRQGIPRVVDNIIYGERGVEFLYAENDYSTYFMQSESHATIETFFELYGCSFTNVDPFQDRIAYLRWCKVYDEDYSGTYGRMYDVVLDTMFQPRSNTFMDFRNVIIRGSAGLTQAFGGEVYGEYNIFDNIIIHGRYFLDQIAGSSNLTLRPSGTIENSVFTYRSNIKLFRQYIMTGHAFIIDLDTGDSLFDEWTFDHTGGGVNDGWAYRQNTMTLNITAPSGAPVEDAEIRFYYNATDDPTLFDSFTTYANGTTDEIILTVGTWHLQNFDQDIDDMLDYNPYRLEIRHDDYMLYNMTFDIYTREDFQVSLTPQVYSFDLTLDPEALIIGDYAILGFLGLLIMVAFLLKIGAWTGYIALIPIILMGFQYYENATDTNNLFWFFIGSLFLAILSLLVSVDKTMSER